jgi:hypothetical protein
MKNLHVLPTDKPSRLYLEFGDGDLCLANNILPQTKRSNNQNIYITSDEEIKEGDRVLDKFNQRWKLEDEKLIAFDSKGIKRFSTDNILGHECKKIILTTDQDLIKDGVQSIDDEFLEWFVQNPSCERVVVSKICQKETISEWWGDLSDKEMEEVFKQTGNFRLGGWGHDIGPTEEDVKDMYLEVHNLDLKELNFNVYYKIIIPQEEPKYIEDEFEMQSRIINKVWDEESKQDQVERMYSEEEVLEILNDCRGENPIDIDKWFEQFKKK